MTKIKELQDELGRMQNTLRELSALEDYSGADYSEVLIDVRWSHQQCKHRLLTLQLRRDNQTTLDGEYNE